MNHQRTASSVIVESQRGETERIIGGIRSHQFSIRATSKLQTTANCRAISVKSLPTYRPLQFFKDYVLLCGHIFSSFNTHGLHGIEVRSLTSMTHPRLAVFCLSPFPLSALSESPDRISRIGFGLLSPSVRPHFPSHSTFVAGWKIEIKSGSISVYGEEREGEILMKGGSQSATESFVRNMFWQKMFGKKLPKC